MSNTHTHVVKSSHLFFDDGDVVISAQCPGSDAVYLFKLHRRVLATQAQGLAGVLSIPAAEANGVDSNEYYEGTPVVHLCDDAAELAWFFLAMYAPSALIFRRSKAINAADAYPLLVLADKYVANDIECMIEFQLSQDWPRTLSEWDAFEYRSVLAYRMWRRTRALGRWDSVIPEPASYIRLARIAKVVERNRVAAAFYQLSRMDIANDWDEKPRAFEKWPENLTFAQLAKKQMAMWSILTEDERHRLEVGKKRITNYVIEVVQTLPNHVNLCLACAQGWKSLGANFVASEDILSEWLGSCVANASLRPYMCIDCQIEVCRVISGERARLWCLLPDYFEVHPNERAHLDTVGTIDSQFVLV